MKLGLQLGYWGAEPLPNALELVHAAERSGFDAVFTAESWGSDAFTPLAWYGASTTSIGLGTAIAQISARTPTATAMAALTLDHLSGGRCVLGLGVSGPQVVEGWYGQPFARPLARTREYISIVREVLAREKAVTNTGEHYPLPYPPDAPGATGLGKSLKPITHPRRTDLPIWMGAEGPKNVALAAEIADGWLPIYYTPRLADEYESWLAEGFAQPNARCSRAEFSVSALATVVVTDDPAAEVEKQRGPMALYIGGMGAQDLNFHAQVYRRMGYGEVVDEVQSRFAEGDKVGAAQAIPDEMVRETMIVGDRGHVRDGVARWEAAGVDMLLVTCRDTATIESLGSLLLQPDHRDGGDDHRDNS